MGWKGYLICRESCYNSPRNSCPSFAQKGKHCHDCLQIDQGTVQSSHESGRIEERSPIVSATKPQRSEEVVHDAVCWVLDLASQGFETWGFPKIRGTILGGPNNKDYSILGCILGSPYFGKLPLLILVLHHSWAGLHCRDQGKLPKL